jgi:hypothetical protein
LTVYNRNTEGDLNDILTILGVTKTSLWPFWEPTGQLVTCIGVGNLIPSETAGAAEDLEHDFAPLKLPCGLYSYHFNPTGDHHLAGTDNAAYSFAAAAFSIGAWIRPHVIVSNTIMSKYSATVREWRFWIDAAGLLDLELYDEAADTTEIAVSSAALTINQMQFVVCTFDGVDATPGMWLYVNGAAVNDGTSTETGAFGTMVDSATPILVGSGGVTATPAAEFAGRIALPFLCGKALAAAEVASLYKITLPMVGLA